MTPKETSGSTQLAVRSSTDVATLDELDRILRTGELGDIPVQVTNDPAAAEAEIIAQLLDARTDDELEGVAQSWADLEGVPIRVDSFKWLPSTFKSNNPNYTPNPVYFVVFGERLDYGEHVVLTCGSKGVCAALVNLAKRGSLPAVRMLTAAKEETAQGGRPLRLVSTDREKAERREAAVRERTQDTSPPDAA